MEKELDNGLYYDWYDIEHAFGWGLLVGAVIAATTLSVIFGPFF